MHEVGLVTQALEIAQEAAERAGGGRIVRLKLRVGALSGVVPEAMAFAFDVVAAGYDAGGAEFEWEEVPVVARCPAGCGDFTPEGAMFECPQCGAYAWEVLQGRELDVVEVELEQDGPTA